MNQFRRSLIWLAGGGPISISKRLMAELLGARELRVREGPLEVVMLRIETSTLHHEETEVLENRAGAGTSTTFFAGGALYVIGGSQADSRQTVTVLHCVFDGNNVPVGGGGIGGNGVFGSLR